MNGGSWGQEREGKGRDIPKNAEADDDHQHGPDERRRHEDPGQAAAGSHGQAVVEKSVGQKWECHDGQWVQGKGGEDLAVQELVQGPKRTATRTVKAGQGAKRAGRIQAAMGGVQEEKQGGRGEQPWDQEGELPPVPKRADRP